MSSVQQTPTSPSTSVITPPAGAVHTESENNPWTINVADHAARTDSPGFVAAKALAQKILAALGIDQSFFGSGAIQMHHGGSLWLIDDTGWFMVQNEAGIEWSAQFCSDPAKLDRLRRNAQRLYAAFPKTIPAMVQMGYKNAQAILETPITDADGIATWVDSIFNSCVPLPTGRHVGTIAATKIGGRHHYPAPITDIDLVKHDDFNLWVIDPQSNTPVAVVPVAPRGSGNATVRVVHADPNTALGAKQVAAENANTALTLDGSSSLAKQAFAQQ
jgi:hypothetical protein